MLPIEASCPIPDCVWNVTAYRVASRREFWRVDQRNIINPKSVNAKIKANVGKRVKTDSRMALPRDLCLRMTELRIREVIGLLLERLTHQIFLIGAL